MKIFYGVKQLPSILPSSVITIGNFDGVHLGHKKILSALISYAQTKGIPSVVMTFDPHPRSVLYPHSTDSQLYPLFDRQDQEDILRQIGLDYLIIESFSKKFAQMAPDVFFNEWMINPFSPKRVVVGYDFAFGVKRQGTIEKLKKMASKSKIEVEVIPPVKINGQIVSSTAIRQALFDNDILLTTQLLSRRFYLRGLLLKNSKELRFQCDKFIPLQGVFETELVLTNGLKYSSLTTIKSTKDVWIQCEDLKNTSLDMPQEIYIFFSKKLSDTGG